MRVGLNATVWIKNCIVLYLHWMLPEPWCWAPPLSVCVCTRQPLGQWGKTSCCPCFSSVAKSCFVCVWEQRWDRKRNSMKLPPDWIMHASICWQKTSLSGLLSVTKHTHRYIHSSLYSHGSIVYRPTLSITNPIPQVNCAIHFNLLHHCSFSWNWLIQEQTHSMHQYSQQVCYSWMSTYTRLYFYVTIRNFKAKGC